MTRIELRKIKYAEFMSRETHCFTAEVWIDGKKAGTAENEGHGGPTDIIPTACYRKLEEYAKTLPPVKTEYVIEGKPWTYQPDAEGVVNDLVEDYLELKELKKLLRNRIVFTKLVEGKLQLFQTNKATKEYLNRRLLQPNAGIEGAVHILNKMSEAAALKLWKEIMK